MSSHNLTPRGATRRRLVAAGTAGLLAAGALASLSAPAGAASTARVGAAHPTRTAAVHRAALSRTQAAREAVARARATGIRGTLRYAVAKPACAPTEPDGYQCYAIRRTPATADTAGAYPYVEPLGITHGPATGYTPADLASAYKINPKIKSSGQTVGIVDWYDDPHALADLNKFDKQYKLPAETTKTFRKVNQNGRSSPLPKAGPKTSDGVLETSLDVQAVRGICHTCHILLVEATVPSDNDLAQSENEAVKLGATEVSNSFGVPEALDQNVSKHTVNAYNHPGTVITASTGDSGWYGWDYFNATGGKSQSSASFPATDPTTVAVGGTELFINKSGGRAAEVVWNENGFDDNGGRGGPAGGTGGGCSGLFTAAAWQSQLTNYKDADCTGGGRLAADVSALADPTLGYDVYDSWAPKGKHDYWQTVGGTSLASPIIAAMYALAGGSHGSAYPASTLYANVRNHPSTVFDVVPFEENEFASGNSYCGGADPDLCDPDPGTNNPNGFGDGLLDCSLPYDGSAIDPDNPPPLSPECNTMKGYDGPTGLGTPSSLKLFKATTPTITISHPATAAHNKVVKFSATADEPIAGTTISGYEWLWGDGSSDATATGNDTHTFTAKGTYTVTLEVVDSQVQETLKKTTIKIT